MGPPSGLTWPYEYPLLTAGDPWTPRLMARQWPDDLGILGYDLQLRRSFRATTPPATIQVRTRAVGLFVPVNDLHGGHVLAQIWHEIVGGPPR
jgi:hypothetical protein